MEFVGGEGTGYDDDKTEYVGWGGETVGLDGGKGAHLTHYCGEKDRERCECNVTSKIH